jgi:hypothetical protein
MISDGKQTNVVNGSRVGKVIAAVVVSLRVDFLVDVCCKGRALSNCDVT